MKIAISGKLCSGKSYLANYLVEKYDGRIYSFGYGVKKYCKELFNMEYKDRKLLQDFAQKMRDIDKDVWVNYTINKINTDNSKHTIIIDDLRFPNEKEKLIKEGFLLICLTIDKELQIERIKKTYPDTYKEHIDRLDDISESYIGTLGIPNIIHITKENENNIHSVVDTYINNFFFV